MIKITAVFTNNNRVAEFFGLILTMPAHNIFPLDYARKQLKAIVRLATFGLKLGNIFRRIAQRLTVINRRFAFGHRAFAFDLQFFRCIIARINTPFGNQFVAHGIIALKTRRLTCFFAPIETEPLQALAHRVFVFFFRAGKIRIINTEHKLAP